MSKQLWAPSVCPFTFILVRGRLLFETKKVLKLARDKLFVSLLPWINLSLPETVSAIFYSPPLSLPMFLFTWTGPFLPVLPVSSVIDTSGWATLLERVGFLILSPRSTGALKDHSAVCGTKLRERSRRQLFDPSIHSLSPWMTFLYRAWFGWRGRVSEWRRKWVDSRGGWGRGCGLK